MIAIVTSLDYGFTKLVIALFGRRAPGPSAEAGHE
jgi:hypothetical protein